jgi:CheY-like chemotaxis protein
VVDDYAPFRDFVRSSLRNLPGAQIVSEARDGLEAVHQAQELQPDLILLDIGLPTLNGIEAARRIRELSPESKILFVSENRSWEIAEVALRTGGSGYVVKSDALRDLLPAVESVLQGKPFISASLAGRDLIDATGTCADDRLHDDGVGVRIPLPNVEIARRHEVGFYSEDRWLVEDVAQFISATLKAENAAIVIATEPHRDSFLASLKARGLDLDAAVDQGKYIALDAADTLSTFMRNGMPDPARFTGAFGKLIQTSAEAAKGQHPRVGVFGECVQLLLAEGNPKAAVQIERLCNQLAEKCDVDILCGYSLDGSRDMLDGDTYQQICAEHSAVHSR